MRVALIYPPPWKIPAAGEAPDASGDGPPRGSAGGELDGNFHTAPYGLLSLAAQAAAAGYPVKTLNLSTFPWHQVEDVVRHLEADVYGLTCFTANRRGVALTADCIRRRHPAACVVVGGPHVSALPEETLRRWPAVDAVVIGEGEHTFLELLGRLSDGRGLEGLAGAAWREGDGTVRIGPPRPRIADLDSLASLHDRFPSTVLLTSRGCPWQCTFCASSAMWGRRVAFHSVSYVLESLEAMLRGLPAPTIAIKDDTFTANRRRAMEVCQGIRHRDLRFLWSCDTRADAVDEELLRAMRLAGCEMISLGVESAAEAVLANIRKRATPQDVIHATQLARKYGIRVRYYMMAGNRGETLATFQKSVDFLAEAKPDQFVFCPLAVYPGTTEFDILHRQEGFLVARPTPQGPKLQARKGPLTAKCFFEEDFQELWVFPDTRMSDAARISEWLVRNGGVRKAPPPDVPACRAVLERLGDHHAAHLDLGAAHARAGQPEQAERHIRRALELGYPIPSLAYSALACAAAQRQDLPAVEANLILALQQDRPHPAAVANAKALQEWLAAGGPKSGTPLKLALRTEFQVVPAICQPVMPAPLAPDALDWPQPRAAATVTA